MLARSDSWDDFLRACRRQQRRLPLWRDRLGVVPSLRESCEQLEFSLQRVTDILSLTDLQRTPTAMIASRLVPWLYSASMLSASASFSCLFEGALAAFVSSDGSWLGGSTLPTSGPARLGAGGDQTPNPKAPPAPPPASTASSTYLDRDWQQNRKLYEGHHHLKVLAEEMQGLLKAALRRTAHGGATQESKAMLTSLDEAMAQLKREHAILSMSKRPSS